MPRWSVRAPLLMGIAVVTVACASPVRTDQARLPAAPASTLPPPTTTLAPPTTTTTTVMASGPDVVAWLAVDAAAGTLREAIAGWEGIRTVELVAGEDALAEFAALYPDRPGLLEGIVGDELPSSLRIELTHPSRLADVAARLRSLSDIDEVVTAVTPVCNAFPGWNIVLFVDDDRQLTRLRNELAAAEGITDIVAVGRAEAYDEFLARFSELPDLATGVGIQDMSVSLRARTTNPVTLSLLGRDFESDPAVRGIQVFNPGVPACP